MNPLGHHCVGQTLADTASPRSLPVSTATNRTERAPHLTSPGGRAASPTMPSAGPPARTARSGPLGFGFPQRRTDFFFFNWLIEILQSMWLTPHPLVALTRAIHPERHKHGTGESQLKEQVQVSNPGIFHPLLCSFLLFFFPSCKCQEGLALHQQWQGSQGMGGESPRLFNFAHTALSTARVIPACGD